MQNGEPGSSPVLLIPFAPVMPKSITGGTHRKSGV